MNLRETTIPNCYEIQCEKRVDKRGYFVKTLHSDVYKGLGLTTVFAEEYYSLSYQGVLRGLHFQTPPMDHTKVVYCVSGEVMDVVVDLRVGSPCYGKFETFLLSGKKSNMLYLPPGLAHGFYVLSQQAIMMYKVTTTYSPENDSGIRWDSVGIPWPNSKPIISPRDQEFPVFKEFASPFRGGV